MGGIKSWECGECTNLCRRPEYDGVYCLPMVEGRHRTEWQGDYLECLDKTLEPKQMVVVMGVEEWEK